MVIYDDMMIYSVFGCDFMVTFHGIFHGTYPLVNFHITMENHYCLYGKTHYFDWAILNSYVKYQRVSTNISSDVIIKIRFGSDSFTRK